MRILIEQDLRAHDHAVHAKAALRCLLFDERCLQQMWMRDAAQSFEGRDALVLRGAGRNGAGPDRFSVHDHGARTALAQAAAKLRAMQPQIVA